MTKLFYIKKIDNVKVRASHSRMNFPCFRLHYLSIHTLKIHLHPQLNHQNFTHYRCDKARRKSHSENHIKNIRFPLYAFIENMLLIKVAASSPVQARLLPPFGLDPSTPIAMSTFVSPDNIAEKGGKSYEKCHAEELTKKTIFDNNHFEVTKKNDFKRKFSSHPSTAELTIELSMLLLMTLSLTSIDLLKLEDDSLLAVVYLTARLVGFLSIRP